MVEITSAGVASGAIDRITKKLFLFIQNKESGNSELEKLLKTLQKSLRLSTSIIEQFYNAGESILVITVPEYNDEDEDTRKCLALLVGAALVLHQTKIENVRLVKDNSLGLGKVTITKSLSKLVADLSASAQNSTGLFAGDVYKFSSGVEFNLVEMVAAMRLLNHKQEFIRKRKFSKDSGKSSVSYNMLLETFNTSTGLKGSGEQSYAIRFIKAMMASCVKAHNKGFPGGWIHASRNRNKVKSDFALLNSLGWTEKCPSNHKMLEVLFNTVDLHDKKDPSSKDRIVNITQDKRKFLFQEFRTAVALTLPRIDTSKPAEHSADMKRDPLSVRSLQICNNFCTAKRDLLVDSLNEAYVLRVSQKNPKSKTKEIHYKIFRDKMLNSSSNIPLIDAKGKSFDKFSNLPQKTQSFLREQFRYPVKPAVPATSVANAPGIVPEVEMNVGGEQPQTQSVPPKRTRTMTRGQAKEAVRKSGRLAQLRTKKS